jgi:hypothetical protein
VRDKYEHTGNPKAERIGQVDLNTSRQFGQRRWQTAMANAFPTSTKQVPRLINFVGEDEPVAHEQEAEDEEAGR